MPLERYRSKIVLEDTSEGSINLSYQDYKYQRLGKTPDIEDNMSYNGTEMENKISHTVSGSKAGMYQIQMIPSAELEDYLIRIKKLKGVTTIKTTLHKSIVALKTLPEFSGLGQQITIDFTVLKELN